MRIPEYMLMQAYKFGPSNSEKELPAGAFVRPIETQYVPKEVVNKYRPSELLFFFDIKNNEPFKFCYTHYGIIPIPERLYRRVV